MFDDNNKKSVQATNGDAVVSKVSASKLGYFKDDFLKYFTSRQACQRCTPLINRGTYVRVAAVRKLVDEFMATEPQCKKQIISLGAGFDTMYFRLKSKKVSTIQIF